MEPILLHISGDGQLADGALLGFRDFMEAMKKKYGIRTQPFAHDEAGLGRRILEIPGPIILSGFSFGGDEATRVVDTFYRAGKAINTLFLLDPKPKSFWKWINPWYAYPIPFGVKSYYCYYSGFGRPFVGGINSDKMNLDHPDFPADKLIHVRIESTIARLCSTSGMPNV